jgi:small subunit ribosomal protein S1
MENLKNVAPIEDFNWDAYENGEGNKRKPRRT